MDNILTYCAVVFTLYLGFITEQAPIPCELGDKTKSCPSGMCCARDEFLLEQVSCKPHGNVDSACTTVKSDSNCPCVDGLICKPDITGSNFVTIYGKCYNVSVSDMTTESESTVEMTTNANRHINHPPVIRFGRLPNSSLKTATVSVYSKVGDEIANFTATDIDRGKEGNVSCSILQPRFLRVMKTNSNSFKIVVATTLRHLSTQTLSAFVICQDGGKSPLNNVVQIRIKITREIVTTVRSTATKTPLVTQTTVSDEFTTSVEEQFSVSNSRASTVSGMSAVFEQFTISKT